MMIHVQCIKITIWSQNSKTTIPFNLGRERAVAEYQLIAYITTVAIAETVLKEPNEGALNLRFLI